MSLESLGGRKFLMTLIALAVGTAVQIYSPHGVTESFTALLVGLIGVFGAANAAVTWKSMATATASSQPAGEPEPAPLPATDLSVIDSAVGRLIQDQEQTALALDAHAQAITTLQQGVDAAQKLAKAAMGLKS